jgi:hypothetical protein
MDFQPTKWELKSNPMECHEAEQKQVLKQVWFPCSHIEAGGRIEEYDDVTYISLIWMAVRFVYLRFFPINVSSLGRCFLPTQANLIHHNLLVINEEYLHGLLSVFWTRVQRGFGLYE